MSEASGRDAALKIAEAAEEAGDLDRALGYYRALTEIEPNNHWWRVHEVRLLNRTGRSEEAAPLLARIFRRWPRLRKHPRLLELLPEVRPTEKNSRIALGDDYPPDEALKRPVVTDDSSADVIVARGGRPTAVVVFTGLADRMLVPIPVFDRYFAELDLTAIYLRDRRRIGYFNGVEGLGADYAETLAALKSLLESNGARTVHTVGNSAGGMGALSYGLDMGAEKILAFSAPLALFEDTLEHDNRASHLNQRILKLPADIRDFRARLDKAEGASEVHVYYGGDMREDRFHALHLRDRPGVHLHSLPGMEGHGSLFQIAHTQGLRPLFAGMFGSSD